MLDPNLSASIPSRWSMDTYRFDIGGGLFGSLVGGLLNLPAKATGGPVYQGGAYLVGEHGPEVFTPEMSGRIIPNGGWSQGGRGGPAVNNFGPFHFHGVTDADSFRKSESQISASMAALLTRHLRRNG